MRTKQRYCPQGQNLLPVVSTAHNSTPTASAAYLEAIAAPKDFRHKIEASIGNVAALYGMSHTQAYTYIGSLMLSIWGIDLTEYDRPYGESILTILVRYRLDARFYSLIQSELTNPEQL